MRRTGPDAVASFAELYVQLSPGELIHGTQHPRFKPWWAAARAESFAPAPQPQPSAQMAEEPATA